jgi:hypothetical protein
MRQQVPDLDPRRRAARARTPKSLGLFTGEAGLLVTETDILALIETRLGLWSEIGDQIDPHLQKADLTAE